jgi:hypothetical protein
VKQPFISIQIYSMMLFIKPSEYLLEYTTGENMAGSEWRKREREKENSGLTE